MMYVGLNFTMAQGVGLDTDRLVDPFYRSSLIRSQPRSLKGAGHSNQPMYIADYGIDEVPNVRFSKEEKERIEGTRGAKTSDLKNYRRPDGIETCIPNVVERPKPSKPKERKSGGSSGTSKRRSSSTGTIGANKKNPVLEEKVRLTCTGKERDLDQRIIPAYQRGRINPRKERQRTSDVMIRSLEPHVKMQERDEQFFQG